MGYDSLDGTWVYIDTSGSTNTVHDTIINYSISGYNDTLGNHIYDENQSSTIE